MGSLLVAELSGVHVSEQMTPLAATEGRRNRPSEVSGFAAFFGVVTVVNYLYLPAAGLLSACCALVAIVAGHLGRRRAQRLDGRGRWMALAGLVTGWLMLVVNLLAVLAYFGLVVGLTLLIDKLN
ncbi:DUF4190 domain-containing protein [Kribbella sp. NBC_01505]|uniref:DUF4190 domain-containing protein n=1 Tax=Kribbella sp. NBC_01505 TaxID=2903580 RepID=UPI00386F98C3